MSKGSKRRLKRLNEDDPDWVLHDEYEESKKRAREVDQAGDAERARPKTLIIPEEVDSMSGLNINWHYNHSFEWFTEGYFNQFRQVKVEDATQEAIQEASSVSAPTATEFQIRDLHTKVTRALCNQVKLWQSMAEREKKLEDKLAEVEKKYDNLCTTLEPVFQRLLTLKRHPRSGTSSLASSVPSSLDEFMPPVIRVPSSLASSTASMKTGAPAVNESISVEGLGQVTAEELAWMVNDDV